MAPHLDGDVQGLRAPAPIRMPAARVDELRLRLERRSHGFDVAVAHRAQESGRFLFSRPVPVLSLHMGVEGAPAGKAVASRDLALGLGQPGPGTSFAQAAQLLLGSLLQPFEACTRGKRIRHDEPSFQVPGVRVPRAERRVSGNEGPGGFHPARGPSVASSTRPCYFPCRGASTCASGCLSGWRQGPGG